MSATIRRIDPRRPATDFYATPEWCTRAVCRWLNKNASTAFEHAEISGHGSRMLPATILDPGAGSGAITRVLRAEWPKADIEAYEILGKFRNDLFLAGLPSNRILIQDFLWANGSHRCNDGSLFDLCVCNPPFSGPNGEDYALAFIKRAMEWSHMGAFLVRLNWLAAAPTPKKLARYEYLKANPPCVLVLGKRPSFMSGKTDATEYCWLIFGVPGLWGQWELLGA